MISLASEAQRSNKQQSTQSPRFNIKMNFDNFKPDIPNNDQSNSQHTNSNRFAHPNLNFEDDLLQNQLNQLAKA